LTSAVRSSLAWACIFGCESIAVPAISSGIFGYPKPLCGETCFRAAEQFALSIEACGVDPSTISLKNIRFTNFDHETTNIFE
jgi:O-acetyl-ADP-ribose deacetylase (regulator of RNase III)